MRPQCPGNRLDYKKHGYGRKPEKMIIKASYYKVQGSQLPYFIQQLQRVIHKIPSSL